jgi:hypothetical protein
MTRTTGWWFHHDERTSTLFIGNGERTQTIWNKEVL